MSVSSLHKSKYKRYQGISNPGNTSQPDLYVCILVRGTYLSCDLRSWMRCPLPQRCPGHKGNPIISNTHQSGKCVKSKRNIYSGVYILALLTRWLSYKVILVKASWKAPQDIKKPIRSFHYGGLDLICTSKRGETRGVGAWESQQGTGEI